MRSSCQSATRDASLSTSLREGLSAPAADAAETANTNAQNAMPNIGGFISDHPSAVDHVNLPGGETGFVAREVQRHCGDLFGLAQPTHGLAGFELRASLRVVAVGVQSRLQRRRIHGAGANGIAANAL